MRAIGIHDQVLGEEPLETLPHRLHADPEPSREGFGLRLTEALQLEQNGVDRRLHAASLRNIARLCLLNIGPPVNDKLSKRRAVEDRAGRRLTWDAFNRIKERTPLLTPKLHLPYRELQALAVL